MGELKLSLKSEDVFQVLDALESRAQAWEATYRYLSGDSQEEDAFTIIEECSNAEEAEAIAQHFRDIIDVINKQIPEK